MSIRLKNAKQTLVLKPVSPIFRKEWIRKGVKFRNLIAKSVLF